MKKERKELEDYEPGATKEEVHKALRLVATYKNRDKKTKKTTSQSDSA